jgi:protocatechuate 3,4-dioxygenase beta subunit
MAHAKLCLLASALCAAIFAQPAGRGVISGTVVEAASGDPVRKAIVTVTWHGTPRSWAVTRTDGSGRFIAEGLPPGNYDLRATKTGLGTAIYGASSVRELGDLITLADGETHGDVKLRFLRSGSISGRVLDPDGDPVSGVDVHLLRSGRNLGERVLTNFRAANTNDRGEYKINMLDPGEYFLRCSPNAVRMGPVLKYGASVPAQDMLAPQYYGAARVSKDAAAVNLRGGEVLTGIDFHLAMEHPAKITGRVTGVPPLAALPDAPGSIQAAHIKRRGGPGIMISLSPADDNQMRWGQGAAANDPDYNFEFPGMIPGRYRVQASVDADGKTYFASQVVDAGEGATDMMLTMTPAVEVKGHLKMEGPGRREAQSFSVALAPAGPRRETYTAQVKKDGSFAIENVPPGEFIFNISPNPEGTFEKSVTLGDKDFLFKRIEIPPGSDAPLNIVLSSNTATVEGQIDAGAADGKRAGILLAPAGKFHTLLRLYHIATADDTGKFKIKGVAPGKYKIFALEKIAPSFYRNPESADVLDAVGEELDVQEGAQVQSNPKLIPEEKAKDLLKP